MLTSKINWQQYPVSAQKATSQKADTTNESVNIFVEMKMLYNKCLFKELSSKTILMDQPYSSTFSSQLLYPYLL